jgi:hypothetical protein
MPKAYWIATYRSINDPEALAEYAKLAGQRYGPREDAIWFEERRQKRLRQEWTCAQLS